MDLQTAKFKFAELLESVDEMVLSDFIDWVAQSVSGVDSSNNGERMQRRKRPKRIREAMKKLDSIAEVLKEKLPFEAVMPTERIAYPTKGYDSDCTTTNTLHIDNFLFTDDDVDKMVNEGKFSRNYCQQCGSQNTQPLNFISHSLSREQIEFMFTKLVPLNQLGAITVLDIGSRMGAVLFGASLLGSDKLKCVGIELNAEFAQLQKALIEEKQFRNIDVYCDDVRNCGDVVKQADVIVMNNVFNFFMSEEEQLSCWEFLHENLKPGSVILHNPALPDVVAHLPLSFRIEDWLDEKDVHKMALEFAGTDDGSEYEDCCQMHMYRVRKGL